MEPTDAGMETPLSELDDAGEAAAAAAAAPKRSLSRRAKRRAAKKEKKEKKDAAPGEVTPLRFGLNYAKSSAWRPLFFVLLVQLLLAMTVVLPFWQGVSSRLDHHPHAAVLAGEDPTALEEVQGWEAGLNPGIWRDLKREQSELFAGLTVTHWWVAIVAWLFGALVAGGFIGTALSGENPARVGAFLSHGAKWYGCMLRIGLLFAISYYLLARLVLEAWGGSVKPTEFMASSESAGFWGERIREALVVLGFFWFCLAADLARAEMVVYSRKSAIRAYLRGLVRALRPKTILLALTIGGPAFLLLLVLGLGTQALTGDGAFTLILLFLVFQVAVLVRWAARAAVLAAFVKLQ